jgi:hypothetical protein
MQQPNAVVMIGGQPFEAVVDGTFEHDQYLVQVTHAAGVFSSAPIFRAAVEGTADLAAVSESLFLAVYESGQTFRLLAGLLTEHGEAWTRGDDMAATMAAVRARAEHFRRVTDAASKDALRAVLLVYLADFFSTGATSSMTASATASSPSTPRTASDAPDAMRPIPTTASGSGVP